MATPRGQRIGIWIIAIVLILGVLGSFFAMILSTQNKATDTSQLQTLYNQYQADVAAQATKLSAVYYDEFSKYSSLPTAFDASSVTELVKKDLKIGDGEELVSGTSYSAYYIGWLPNGTIFDQSISNGALKAPITGGSMITGWENGVIGMKVGGVRELTIPSDQAYGSSGSGDSIPADTPLKFIVMVIPKTDEVPVPDALLEYYQSLYS